MKGYDVNDFFIMLYSALNVDVNSSICASSSGAFCYVRNKTLKVFRKVDTENMLHPISSHIINFSSVTFYLADFYRRVSTYDDVSSLTSLQYIYTAKYNYVIVRYELDCPFKTISG